VIPLRDDVTARTIPFVNIALIGLNAFAFVMELGMGPAVVRFIDRAVDIHDLGEDVRLMLKRCIDPLATDEPYEALPK